MEENTEGVERIGAKLSLRLTRVIKAERKRVFDAWTQPESMRVWFAPGNMTVPEIHNDLKVGGQYRIAIEGFYGRARRDGSKRGVKPSCCGTWRVP